MPHLHRSAYFIPALLLGTMLILMVASSWNDSAIIDELAHIPAAYSYVFLGDYRLNPEHPPLIKDLAALPLIFKKLNFPTSVPSWTTDVNGQWTQGAIFLYEADNDPDSILHLMRFPIMLLALLLGGFLWYWAHRHFGRRVANLSLFFYAFSPTVITHARFVTTDIGAAFGFFIGIVAFLKFLANPSPKNIVIAGVAFGVAELLKFSLILLVPVYGVLLLAYALSRLEFDWKKRLTLFSSLAGKTLAIGAIGILVISAVYAYHVWNYPPDRQFRDAEFLLSSFRYRSWVAFDLWLIAHPMFRALGQYFFGLFMVLQRAAGGNTQYFLGDVSAGGSRLYFPLLYLLKEPLALHILLVIALGFAFMRVVRAQKKSVATILTWVHDHFVEFSSLAFIGIYWTSSLSSPLNIGVRHVLPTFPFIFVLVAKEIISWLRSWPTDEATTWWEWLKRVYQIYVASIPRYLFVGMLVLWQAGSVLGAYPNYLSYFNELGGGTENGYRIAVDSNYDWGQDLKRLRDFVEVNKIQKIAVDYFGGGSPRYYLGGGVFEPWSSAKGYPSTDSVSSPQASSGQARASGGWLAVSATFQMSSYGRPINNFQRKPEDSYQWLKPFRPVARAGKSIFIYQLPVENPESNP